MSSTPLCPHSGGRADLIASRSPPGPQTPSKEPRSLHVDVIFVILLHLFVFWRAWSHFDRLIDENCKMVPPIWDHFGGQFGYLFFELCSFVAMFCDILGDSEKSAKIDLSRRGVDMQSDHAGTCFVRVGRRRRGSILGSIFE